MSKSVKGTKTEQNLLKSFAGESQARNRYTYFAGAARKEGYVQIADIFEETANQEKEHAKRFFSFLEGGMVEFTATFPAGVIGTTAENLLEAANGELEEHSDLYPGFAAVAKEEGFAEIAALWTAVCVAEKQHESVIVTCWPTSRPAGSSSASRSWCGVAATAVTCTATTPLQSFAQPVPTPRPILSC